jgi:hypothetical protein
MGIRYHTSRLHCTKHSKVHNQSFFCLHTQPLLRLIGLNKMCVKTDEKLCLSTKSQQIHNNMIIVKCFRASISVAMSGDF